MFYVIILMQLRYTRNMDSSKTENPRRDMLITLRLLFALRWYMNLMRHNAHDSNDEWIEKDLWEDVRKWNENIVFSGDQ